MPYDGGMTSMSKATALDAAYEAGIRRAKQDLGWRIVARGLERAEGFPDAIRHLGVAGDVGRTMRTNMLVVLCRSSCLGKPARRLATAHGCCVRNNARCAVRAIVDLHFSRFQKGT